MTTTTTPATTTTTTTTTTNAFLWGTDNWSASHDALVLEYIANGYALLEEHEENLFASLNAMERARIRQIASSQWLGAEYGMTVTEILAKSGIFSLPMWDPSVDSVYELDLSDSRNLSLISYYQLLQESDVVQQEIAWTSTYVNRKSVLMNLITQASQAQKGGDMVLVCLFAENASHAAIAYGVEYGHWSLNGSIYDGRILMADPYMTEFSSEVCLYFKSSTMEWCVPKWGFSDRDENQFIGLATNALSLINYAGYFGGTSSVTKTHYHIPILEVPAEAEEFILTPIGAEDAAAQSSTSLSWFSTVASAVTHRRAGLDYQADGYRIEPLNAGEISYQMSYEKCLLSVSADQAESVLLLSGGGIDLTASDSNFRIESISESLLPWTDLTLSGTSCENLSIQPQEDGILVEGNCIDTMMITAEDTNAVYSRQMKTLTDGTGYTTAWIYKLPDGSIGILVDTDGDGTCETELEKEAIAPEDVVYGDVNLDGMISLKDVVVLNRYFAKAADLSEMARLNADCDNSQRINMIDALVILQYIVRTIPELPITVEQ